MVSYVPFQVLDINDNPPFIIPQLEIFGGVVVNSSESFQIDVNAQDVDTQLNTNFYFDIDGEIVASDGSVGLDSVAENAFLIDRRPFMNAQMSIYDLFEVLGNHNLSPSFELDLQIYSFQQS